MLRVCSGYPLRVSQFQIESTFYRVQGNLVGVGVSSDAHGGRGKSVVKKHLEGVSLQADKYLFNLCVDKVGDIAHKGGEHKGGLIRNIYDKCVEMY